MTILHKYHVLEETRSKNAHIWRRSHITLYCLTAIFGALSTWWFYKVLLVFGGNCVLNPSSIGFATFPGDITIDLADMEDPRMKHWTSSPLMNYSHSSTVDRTKTSNVNDNSGHRLTIVDLIHTSWAPEDTCDFIIYAPVLSVIFGLIWMVFFIMCPPSGEKSITGMEQPWRILIPAGVFSLVMFVVSLHAAWNISDGLANLCKHLYSATGSYQCNSKMDTLVPAPSRSAVGASLLVKLSVWCIWLCAFCWVACVLLVLARLLIAPDFKTFTTTPSFAEAGIDEPSTATMETRLDSTHLNGPETLATDKSLDKTDVVVPSAASSSDEQVAREYGQASMLPLTRNTGKAKTQLSGSESSDTLLSPVQADTVLPIVPPAASSSDEQVAREYGEASMLPLTRNTRTAKTQLSGPESSDTLLSPVKADTVLPIVPPAASSSDEQVAREYGKASMLPLTRNTGTAKTQLSGPETSSVVKEGFVEPSTSNEEIPRRYKTDDSVK